MAVNKTELKVLVGVEGTEKLRGLTSSLKKLTDTTKLTDKASKQLRNNLKQQFSNAGRSINQTQALASSYRQLARNVDMTSREFREATREANKLDKQLAKMQRRNRGGIGGRLGGLAKTAGAIGAAGIFGGAEGFAGAALGGVLGGTQGAIVGGTAGATLGALRESIGEIGKYNAQLRQQQFALKLVIKDTDKYNKAQEFLSKTSEELAIPQDVIVRQFTQLTASVIGAGKSVEDAQDVFLSIASGIRGTGGSLEDMRSAMVATSQVFSKGKVSAEELRQQLGERLPGAFTLFAASMGKTPAELDKALEQGKVTLDDFLGFSKHLFKNYGENAKILADSPAAAGDRLATEFSNLKQNFGGIVANIGANFQTFTVNILKSLNDNQENVKKFIANVGNFFIGGFNVVKKVVVDVFNVVKNVVIGIGKAIANAFQFVTNFINGSIDAINDSVNKLKDVPLIGNLFKDFKDIENITIGDTVSGLTSFLFPITNIDAVKDYGNELKKVFNTSKKLSVSEFFEPPKEFTDLLNSSITAMSDLNTETAKLKETSNALFTGLKDGMKGYFDSIKSVAEEIQGAVKNAFQGMEDALVKFVMTGKLNFAEFTRSVLADLTRIAIRQAMLNMFGGIFPFLRNAQGNAFGANGVIPYAKGGVVNSPTVFPFKNGVGLMGEAGAEAILPLKRGRSGNLGVEASGSSNNIVVNVDASGTEVQGDDSQSSQLGKLIGLAVQQELVKQQRAGGLLSRA
tara:strand:+ start:2599 stop:4824 length:2226 start_codon:yes stop_codon:yes gene_type:complete